MTFTKQGPFTKKVTDLPDTPSPNFTPAEIKTHFQTPVDELATTHNLLVDELEADTGATGIGAKHIDGTPSTTQALLDKRGNDLTTHKEAVVLDHPDQSVTTSKLKDKAVTSGKIGDGEVKTVNIENLSVTNDKLATGITGDKIATKQIGREHVKSGAIGLTELDPAIISQPGDGIAEQAKFASIDAQLADMATYSDILTPKSIVRSIAHRGLSSLAPENTLPSYELAGINGFWGGETDVQVTADGVWIVMHDSTVDRTTNGTGNIKDMTLSQIKALLIDTGNNISRYPNLRVPTFEEYLFTCKKYSLVPVIEIKNNPYTSTNYDDFISILKKMKMENKCVVISDNPAICTEIRNRSKIIPIQPVLIINQTYIDFIKDLGNASFDSRHLDLTKELIELAHSNNILVNCWTVDDINRANELISWGVDFITTNKLMWGVHND